MTRAYSPRRTLMAELKKWQQRLDMLSWPARLHHLWPEWMPGHESNYMRQHLAKRCKQEIDRLQKELNEHVRT